MTAFALLAVLSFGGIVCGYAALLSFNVTPDSPYFAPTPEAIPIPAVAKVKRMAIAETSIGASHDWREIPATDWPAIVGALRAYRLWKSDPDIGVCTWIETSIALRVEFEDGSRLDANTYPDLCTLVSPEINGSSLTGRYNLPAGMNQICGPIVAAATKR